MSDWVRVVEAAYSLDGDEAQWLGGVLDVARPLMPHAPRAYALTYDASDPRGMRFETVVTRDFPRGKGRAEIEFAHMGLAAADVERAFGRTACATASQVLDGAHHEKLRLATFAPFGVRDSFGVNSMDPTGRGSMLVGLLPRTSRVDVDTVGVWTRVAAHLAAGRRLRRALGGPLPRDPSTHEQVEAVLDGRGKLHHATGDEAKRARARLASAAVEIERARGKRRARGAEAIVGWRAMVGARWSLVDHFERDGKRYLVAVRNEAPIDALRQLSLRERQVVGFALLGHANKVIAYELGVSPSTVGVLLGRANRKLGLASRSQLLKAFAG